MSLISELCSVAAITLCRLVWSRGCSTWSLRVSEQSSGLGSSECWCLLAVSEVTITIRRKSITDLVFDCSQALKCWAAPLLTRLSPRARHSAWSSSSPWCWSSWCSALRQTPTTPTTLRWGWLLIGQMSHLKASDRPDVTSKGFWSASCHHEGLWLVRFHHDGFWSASNNHDCFWLVNNTNYCLWLVRARPPWPLDCPSPRVICSPSPWPAPAWTPPAPWARPWCLASAGTTTGSTGWAPSQAGWPRLSSTSSSSRSGPPTTQNWATHESR